MASWLSRAATPPWAMARAPVAAVTAVVVALGVVLFARRDLA